MVEPLASQHDLQDRAEQPGTQPATSPTLETPAVPPAVRRGKWQWSLTTLLLLTAAVAAWTAYYRANHEAAELRSEIESMQSLTRTLVVDDLAQYAVVRKLENWNDENRWEVYLPPGHTYHVKLATEQIDEKTFPEADEQLVLTPGRHRLELVSEGLKNENRHIMILLDDKLVVKLTKAADWHTGGGWNQTGGFGQSEQRSVSERLVFMRRRFTRARPDGSWRTSTDPSPGILLWIESSAINSPAAK
jgi:hypothetical protein